MRFGVFRDAPRDEVERIATEVGLDVVQLHGNESPEYAASLSFPVLKVIPADAGRARRGRAPIRARTSCSTHPSGGGSGRTWDFARALPLVASGRRVWIAGGLDARERRPRR